MKSFTNTRVFLRNRDTRQYCTASAGLSGDSSVAHDFETVENAIELARTQRLGDMEVVLRSDDPACDLILPLRQAPKPTAPKTRSVSFALHEPDAKRVSLCGDFNGWSSTATPMTRHDGGHWEVTVAFAPGRYHYKFVADGEWITDPLAHENVWNQHGTLNSVIEVQF
jgi:1,4-alpha-glucan branching enzyme